MGNNVERTLLPGKIRMVYIVAFVASLLLVAFALRWHVVEADKFLVLAAARNRTESIASLRGTIYASDGSTLAYSRPKYNIYIYYNDLVVKEENGLQTRSEFVEKMAPFVDMTPEQLEELMEDKFSKGMRWFKVGESVTIEEGKEIQSLTRDKDKDIENEAERGKLEGYTLLPTYERIYPEGKLAAQVLGLTAVTEDENFEIKTVGLSGLESEWDGILEPLEGYIIGEVDGLGNVVTSATEETIEAKRGSSIYTSIDKRLQEKVQEQLERGVNDYHANSGSAIVMDPRTGEVLALANYPTYDPNLREQEDASAYGNKAISEPYEIGSVGKAFTMASALEAGVVEPDDILLPNGHNGCMHLVDGLDDVCTALKLPVGPIPIKDAFKQSDNLYFITLAELMEKKTFYEFLRNFGVGQVTGVDVAGESIGSLLNWNEWGRADVAAYSYGHSYQANLLQVANGYATLANYGVRMQPRFVNKVVEADGTEKVYEPTPIEQVVSKETVQKMDDMMYEIYLANLPYWDSWLGEYRIAMKSGTALIPYRDRAGYSSEFNATYAGYDASPDRSFVLVVRLDSPQIGELSSYNARYVWIETFKAIKDIIGVRRRGDF